MRFKWRFFSGTVDLLMNRIKYRHYKKDGESVVKTQEAYKKAYCLIL